MIGYSRAFNELYGPKPIEGKSKMNERIRELSFEAQRYALDNTTGPDLASLHELWQEKFAELLIRECADMCERIAKVHLEEESPIAYVYGSRQCRDTIKQYFGVEE